MYCTVMTELINKPEKKYIRDIRIKQKFTKFIKGHQQYL